MQAARLLLFLLQWFAVCQGGSQVAGWAGFVKSFGASSCQQFDWQAEQLL